MWNHPKFTFFGAALLMGGVVNCVEVAKTDEALIVSSATEAFKRGEFENA
tara:strand:- start:37 stop:186 length:150 start_codon:yes stop_codon:yes gene_type:complete